MINFNIPPLVGSELKYIKEAMENKKLCGDGPFTKKCQKLLQDISRTRTALLTPSCTAALEMAAILIDIQKGDEVIMPSYTFVSTANAFVLRGAKIVFVDIRSDTMNIDEKKIEEAITSRTKAIVPVHYAGVACEMDAIMNIATKHSLWVIEDAAQGVMSKYKGKALGSIGHLGCYSFHETKNYTSGGEGGALLVNDADLVKRAEIIREKGTDRSLFLKGVVDKYTWRDIGSSFLPSELQAAYLFAQLECADEINNKRKDVWDKYLSLFSQFSDQLNTPIVPSDCEHNAHMFFVKFNSKMIRDDFIDRMGLNGVTCVFHYIPLHSSEAGMNFGVFAGEDVFTTSESNKLVRMPLYFNLSEEDLESVLNITKKVLEDMFCGR
ncbi:dTDP-4-amino-4,6-dideoxygalactose transaminase [Photobacterium halotolerans]|uniref:dTDP-4-amino-4,6-dideoxygalactose transaminase n=1 Tax=Photobacterium halotolerans TaxID=265726 RepID=UPI0004222B30|nr:dTDP-4-amino-4,6-dideoxygalactose transaminase [Photobacterium halotolerans]